MVMKYRVRRVDERLNFLRSSVLYVFIRSLDFADEKQRQIENWNTNKSNQFRDFRRDLIVVKSSLSIDAKVCSVLEMMYIDGLFL